MEPFTIILSASGIILTIALAILVFRLWSTLGELEQFIRETRGETTPILRKTDRSLERLDRISELIENRVVETDQDLESISRDLKITSSNIREFSEEWKDELKPNGRWSGWISTVFSSGLKIFQSLRSQSSKKGGTKNG